jgi:hypothetical protein
MNAGMAAALLVHALDEQAKAFYLGHGFIASPIEPMTLMLRVWRRQRHDCYFLMNILPGNIYCNNGLLFIFRSYLYCFGLHL